MSFPREVAFWVPVKTWPGIRGRRLTSFSTQVVSYELDNISAGGVQQGLRLPGRSNPVRSSDPSSKALQKSRRES